MACRSPDWDPWFRKTALLDIGQWHFCVTGRIKIGRLLVCRRQSIDFRLVSETMKTYQKNVVWWHYLLSNCTIVCTNVHVCGRWRSLLSYYFYYWIVFAAVRWAAMEIRFQSKKKNPGKPINPANDGMRGKADVLWLQWNRCSLENTFCNSLTEGTTLNRWGDIEFCLHFGTTTV